MHSNKNGKGDLHTMKKLILLLAFSVIGFTYSQSASTMLLLMGDDVSDYQPPAGYEFFITSDGDTLKTNDGEYFLVPLPSWDETIFMNWLTDGVAILSNEVGQFDERLEEPELIIKDNQLYLFYAAWDNGTPNVGSIGLATGSSLSSLVKVGQVLVPSVSGWDNAYVSGQRIYYENGTYYLFYFGSSIEAFEGEPASIGVATSTNLTDWTKYAGNPILTIGSVGSWDSDILYRPYVLKKENTYYLFYNARRSDDKEQIGFATSSNLFGPWTKYGGNPILSFGGAGEWDDDRIGDPYILPFIFEDQPLWVMFYYGAGNPHAEGEIGIAVSRDLMTWTKSLDNPITMTWQASSGYSIRPSIKLIDNIWVMLFDNIGTGIYKALLNN